jgi:hypothetical protein
MGVVVSAGSGKQYPLCPAGVEQGVCCDIIDLGMVASEYEGKTTTKHKVVLCWQVAEVDPETKKRFVVGKRYTASLHEKATMTKDLEGWRGRPFTAEEKRGFDLDNVLGVNGLLNIVHNQGRDGKTYANVAGIMPLPRNTPKLTVQDYIRVKDRQPEPEPVTPPNDGEFHASDDDVPFAAFLAPLAGFFLAGARFFA